MSNAVENLKQFTCLADLFWKVLDNEWITVEIPLLIDKKASSRLEVMTTWISILRELKDQKNFPEKVGDGRSIKISGCYQRSKRGWKIVRFRKP